MKKHKHLDFFGVPITGTVDEMIRNLVKSDLIEPESELSRLARSMEQGHENVVLFGKHPELSGETFLLDITSNKISGQIYQVRIFFSDENLVYYAKAFKLITQTYGNSQQGTISTLLRWPLDDGEIVVYHHTDGTTFIQFIDKLNKPEDEE